MQADLVTIPSAAVKVAWPRLLGAWGWRRELRRAREEADHELLHSAFTSPRTSWRAAELTTPKRRLALARSIERLVRSADGRYLPGPMPLNRAAIRENASTLHELASRLTQLERPVSPRGVLLLETLLTDGFGPLYVQYRAMELKDTLARAADALASRR